MKFLLRRIQGLVSAFLYPGWGSCNRCDRTWNTCKRHHTQYTDCLECFPLCEDCWQELTPEQRLPFYRKLFDSWVAYGDKDHHGLSWEKTWRKIKWAVLQGE